MERWTPTAGTPQGAVISPLLANIYLHPLDELMAALRLSDGALCGRLRGSVQEPRGGRGRAGGDQALGGGQRLASASGQNAYRRLPASRGRVRVPRLPVRSRPALGPQEEPDAPQGQHPGQDATHARATASRGSSPTSTRCCAAGLATSSTRIPTPSAMLDGFVRRRLRAILRKQEKRPGFGRCLDDHQRWPNAFFAQAGLFALTHGLAGARQSR